MTCGHCDNNYNEGYDAGYIKGLLDALDPEVDLNWGDPESLKLLDKMVESEWSQDTEYDKEGLDV